MANSVDISQYKNNFTFQNKVYRLIWGIVYYLFFRVLNFRCFKRFRNFILRCFGAQVGENSLVHASVKIWSPRNLIIGDYTCIGPQVDIYHQGKITIGDNTTISQKVSLCASTHDISDKKNPLILKPIHIADQVWLAADAFIGPGVTIGEGAVVGARSVVFKGVDAWTVVGGNPAQFIKNRVIKK